MIILLFLFSFAHFNVSGVCKLLLIVVVLLNLFCFVCMFLFNVNYAIFWGFSNLSLQNQNHFHFAALLNCSMYV